MSSERKRTKETEFETNTIQSQPEAQPLIMPPSTEKVPREMEELINLLTELFQETSELVLASMEIDDEVIETYPQLRELKESCARVARIVRKIIKLGRKLPRQVQVK